MGFVYPATWGSVNKVLVILRTVSELDKKKASFIRVLATINLDSMSLKEYNERFNQIEKGITEMDVNELEDKVYTLEEDIREELEICLPSEEKDLQNLLNKIVSFKKENDFYDADAELNRMFPDRNDDDFDEDSTSYDSVFGKH
jgi:hypothetical protein